MKTIETKILRLTREKQHYTTYLYTVSASCQDCLYTVKFSFSVDTMSHVMAMAEALTVFNQRADSKLKIVKTEFTVRDSLDLKYSLTVFAACTSGRAIEVQEDILRNYLNEVISLPKIMCIKQ